MKMSVEEIIQQKAFATLSVEERLDVQELCADELEFNQMKQFLTEMGNITQPIVEAINPSVKTSLDAIFAVKHPAIQSVVATQRVVEVSIIPLYQRTWFQIAALLVIIGGVVPFWSVISMQTPMNKEDSLAKLELPVQKEIKSEETTSNEKSADLVLPSPVQQNKVVKKLQDRVFAEVSKPISSAERSTSSFASSSSIDEPSAITTLSIAGRSADLYPVGTSTSKSIASQPNDFLDLLAPAF